MLSLSFPEILSPNWQAKLITTRTVTCRLILNGANVVWKHFPIVDPSENKKVKMKSR